MAHLSVAQAKVWGNALDAIEEAESVDAALDALRDMLLLTASDRGRDVRWAISQAKGLAQQERWQATAHEEAYKAKASVDKNATVHEGIPVPSEE